MRAMEWQDHGEGKFSVFLFLLSSADRAQHLPRPVLLDMTAAVVMSLMAPVVKNSSHSQVCETAAKKDRGERRGCET